MSTHILTQAQLKTQLHYAPDTGLFTWRATRSGHRAKGTVAGSTDSRGYRVIQIDKHKCKAHRLAVLYITGAWPEHEVDHRDHNRSNNKWENLRSVTHAQNQRNKRRQANNTSGVTGVSWRAKYRRWRVQINIAGKVVNCGSFKSKQEAISKRQQLEKEYNFHANHGKGTT